MPCRQFLQPLPMPVFYTYEEYTFLYFYYKHLFGVFMLRILKIFEPASLVLSNQCYFFRIAVNINCVVDWVEITPLTWFTLKFNRKNLISFQKLENFHSFLYITPQKKRWNFRLKPINFSLPFITSMSTSTLILPSMTFMNSFISVLHMSIYTNRQLPCLSFRHLRINILSTCSFKSEYASIPCTDIFSI